MIVTTQSFQRSVLSSVLTLAERDASVAARRMQLVSISVRVEHFSSPYDVIFKAMLVYFRTVAAIITYEHFVDLLKRRSLEEVTLNEAVAAFVELRTQPIPPENEFRYQLQRLKEVTKTDRLTEALVDTMDVLMSGKKIKNRMVFGYDGAVNYLHKRLAELGREDVGGSRILVNSDMSRVISDYSDRKFGRRVGYRTNFGEVDEATSGGFQPGDLVFLAGYTSEGKSTLLNTLVDGWVYGGPKLNVAFGSAEHPEEVVQRRLVAIRSSDPKYGMALDYKKIKEGRLSGTEEKTFERVVLDMAQGDYGKIAVFKIPENATATSVFEIVKSINQIFPVHLFAWDYLNYATSEVTRSTDREEGTHVIRKTKVLASNFDGRGVAVVSPFQVSRGKYEAALKSGAYNLTCMAETSEAEKASDVVWSILMLPEQSRTVGQVLKNRDGPRHSSPFDMVLDVKGMRFAPRASNISL